MSVNLTGIDTGSSRTVSIFLSIFYKKGQPNITHRATVCGVIWRESLWLLLQTQSFFFFFNISQLLLHIVLSLSLQIFPALKPACYLPPFTSSSCWCLISDHTLAVRFTQTLISAWYIHAPKSTRPHGGPTRGALWIRPTVKQGTQRFENLLS